jgi:hypothetical protein
MNLWHAPPGAIVVPLCRSFGREPERQDLCVDHRPLVHSSLSPSPSIELMMVGRTYSFSAART